MPFNGLLMGCSREYWYGAIQKIFKIAGTESFTWSKIMTTYPDISKSVLSRLKCSGYIQKDKRPVIINGKPKIPKTVMWRLHPEAVAMCRSNGNTKPTNIVKQKSVMKKCICKPKIIKKVNH
jgi:hypothetical protein